ncbi:unnamed protein product [Phytomonas sp. Hart1]|nr:unnamed protein product [Phytomonas sp. Hart1]|eukprot:CCW66194.1 unnamed protein product [Phytomonas sp. isolate Hart1]
MHSRTTWPSRINFQIFHSYLAGCTPDEVVEYLRSFLVQESRRISCSSLSLSISTSSQMLSFIRSHVSFNETHLGDKTMEANGEKTTNTTTKSLHAALIEGERPEASESPQIPPSRGKRRVHSRRERHTHAHRVHSLSGQPYGGAIKHSNPQVKCAHDLDGPCRHFGGKMEDSLLNPLEEVFPSLATLAVAAGYARAQSLSDPRSVLLRKKGHSKHLHPNDDPIDTTSNRKHSADGLSSDTFFLRGLPQNVHFNYQEYRNYLFNLEPDTSVESAKENKSLASVGPTTLMQLLREEIIEQYNLYNYLTEEMEHGVNKPYAFLSCNYLPIPISDRRKLVELYYAVDPVVFRYYFGTKAVHFDPLMGTEEERKGYGLFQRGGGPGEGKGLEKMMAHIAKISSLSLQRQQGNIKRVCTSLIDFYHGKNHAIIPNTVSIFSAVKRCFGVADQLAFHYGTAVFGAFYNLRGRISDRLGSYDEVCGLCNVIMALWCDESQLFLDDAFTAGMNRVAALLEEHRVLAELHQGIFGEAMRTRWQVQLDEVQRAMMPNSTGGEKVTSGSTLNTFSAAAHGNATEGKRGKSCSSNLSESGMHGSASSTAFTHGAMEPSAPSLAAAHSFSCDRKYSRRFVLEFHHIMRHLTRMMVAIGGNRSVSDALEVFYNRLFVYLESLSSRAGQEAGGSSAIPSTTPTAKNVISTPAQSSPTPPFGEDAGAATPARARAIGPANFRERGKFAREGDPPIPRIPDRHGLFTARAGRAVEVDVGAVLQKGLFQAPGVLGGELAAGLPAKRLLDRSRGADASAPLPPPRGPPRGPPWRPRPIHRRRPRGGGGGWREFSPGP